MRTAGSPGRGAAARRGSAATRPSASRWIATATPPSRRRRRDSAPGAGGGAAGGAGARDPDRQVVLDGVERPPLEAARDVRGERDDVLLAGQAVVVRADPPLAEPQVPDALAVEPLERQARREAAAGDRRVDGHLDAVAAMARDERGRVGPRRGVARPAGAAGSAPGAASPDTASTPSSTRTAARLGVRRQRLRDDRERAAAGFGPHAHQPARTRRDPHRAEADVRREPQRRRPPARPGERGERQLGLALALRRAERRTQRLGAVAAQHELGCVAGRADHEHAPLLDLDAPSDRVCGSAGRHAA